MRIGVLSDAHGNEAGLNLALSFLERQKVDGIVYLGDAVGYMSGSGAVCQGLIEAGAVCLMGNHEGMASGRLPVPYGADEILHLPAWESLPGEWRGMVEHNGPRLEMTMGGRRILCAHGSPDEPFTRYVNGGEAADVAFDADVLLLGHTHRPFVARTARGLVVNPGSCGLPRDRGDLLSAAVVDLDTLEATVFRLPYTPDATLLDTVHPMVAALFDRREPNLFGQIWSEDS